MKEIQKYNNRDFDICKMDVGQNSYMNIAKNTNESEYENYVEELVKAGFEKYAENKIENNSFTTLVDDKQTVNVMYLHGFAQTRVVVDDRAVFGLPGLESENSYEKICEPSLTVTGIGASGWPGGMGFVYKLEDGSFFIIDGGITKADTPKPEKCSAEWLYYTLRSLAEDPDNIVVSAWLITHIHIDHLGALTDMSKDRKYTDKIKVKKIIFNQPSDAQMNEADNKTIGCRIPWMMDAAKAWKAESVVKAHPGQVFWLRDLKLTVLGSQDLICENIVANHNSMSVVSKVSFHGKETLFLGDAEKDMNTALTTLYDTELKSDILQLTHHGYGGTGAEGVYALANPSIVFWPVHTGHYDGSYGAEVRLESINQRFFKEGITNHIAGEDNMTIKNFDTWEPEKRWNAME